jgi:hypothetical protein
VQHAKHEESKLGDLLLQLAVTLLTKIISVTKQSQNAKSAKCTSQISMHVIIDQHEKSTRSRHLRKALRTTTPLKNNNSGRLRRGVISPSQKVPAVLEGSVDTETMLPVNPY